MSDLLTASEVGRLADREAVIERGLATFVDVGTALAEIRDERLYRAEHGTFEDYCRERWGFDRTRAQNFITAARTALEISNSGMPAPAVESQARELARVPAGQRADVWQQTIERTEGKPTAAAIRETYAPPAAPTPDPLPAPVAAEIAEQVEARRSVAEALDRFVPDPDGPHRGWRLAFLGALRPAFSVPAQFSVDQFAEHADDVCLDELRRAAEAIGDYYERARSAVPNPDNVRHLRAV